MGGGAFIRVCRASIPVRNSRAKIFLIKGTGSSNYAELKETKHCVRRRGGETSFSMYLQAAAPMFTGPRSKREPHATTQPPCTPQPRPDSRRGDVAPSRSPSRPHHGPWKITSYGTTCITAKRSSSSVEWGSGEYMYEHTFGAAVRRGQRVVSIVCDSQWTIFVIWHTVCGSYAPPYLVNLHNDRNKWKHIHILFFAPFSTIILLQGPVLPRSDLTSSRPKNRRRRCMRRRRLTSGCMDAGSRGPYNSSLTPLSPVPDCNRMDKTGYT